MNNTHDQVGLTTTTAKRTFVGKGKLLEFAEAIDILLTVADERGKIRTKPYRRDEFLAIKLYAHLKSLHTLLKGDEVRGTKVLDMFSSHVVLRSAIESFLTYQYLYKIPTSHREREIRTLLWEYGGFFQWKDFPDDGRFHDKKEEVMSGFEAIRKSILEHDSFDSLPDDVKKRVEERRKIKNARVLSNGWTSIMDEANVPEHLRTYWEIASSHAHSECLSNRQFMDDYHTYSGYDESKIVLFVNIGIYLAVSMSRQLADEYPSCKTAMDNMNSLAKLLYA